MINQWINYIKKRKKLCIAIVAVVIIAIAAACIYFYVNHTNPIEVRYDAFYEQAKAGKVQKIEYSSGKDTFTYYLKGDEETVYKTDNPKVEDFKEKMLLFGVEEFTESHRLSGKEIFSIAIDLLLVAAFFAIFMSMGILSGGSNELEKRPNVTFDQVAGLEEIKEELKTLQNVLEHADLCGDYGVRPPKGVLLEGPPGNGKTFLAKAFAGESGLNFFATNASQFGNVYAGLGANQIAKLFKNAKDKAPSVIFIDELDSIGAKRNGDGSAAGRDNTKTLTALLSAMDGFKPEDHVIVIAATNRVADLDSALIRPGRFDKHFHVPLPDKKTREELVKLYMKNKKFADDVDMEWVVSEVCGSSCAAIESILNEAALLAIQEHDKSSEVMITREMIETAIIKMEIKGHIKKNRQTNEKTKRITAYHEAGHTVATALLTDHELTRVTILPSTSGVGGYTKSTQKENTLHSAEQIRHELMVLYAGRQAELVLAGHNAEEVTIGCSNDIERATQILQNVVNYSDLMGKGSIVDYTQFGNTGLEKSLDIAEEISAQALKATEEFITKHWAKVECVAKALLEKETLQGSEVMELLGR